MLVIEKSIFYYECLKFYFVQYSCININVEDYLCGVIFCQKTYVENRK